MAGASRTPPILGQALQLLGGHHRLTDPGLRQAAWVARCVGRGEAAPLGSAEIAVLADTLRSRPLASGSVLFTGGGEPPGVWIVRDGRVELSVGSGRRRVVVDLLRPGDVDGDLPLLLDMAAPYTARALSDARCLFLARADFEELLATRAAFARRWLSSVAQRLAASQARIVALLGHSLTEQVARLLLDEAVDGEVRLPQRTLAAMLGAQRPSLNKILKDLERDGAITIGYATITITDRDRLSAHAS